RRPAEASCAAFARAAGAVVLGKTVTTEFACFTPGKTANPRNPAHTPGGSSRGSAAAGADRTGAAASWRPTRLGERLARRGARLDGAARLRDADCRLGDPAGRVLRHRRL